MDEPAGVFRTDGSSTYHPTEAAVGPWDPALVHGAAIAGLLAGALTPTDGTLTRFTLDVLAPVPMAPLQLDRSAPTGGRRIQRQEASLTTGGKVVAVGRSVVVRAAELDLPAGIAVQPGPFDHDRAPMPGAPSREVASVIGWESFDSLACTSRQVRIDGDDRVHQWVGLALPIVEGQPLRGTELVAVAADYAQAAIHPHLPWQRWSFRNAELTIHLARMPEGPWIGVRADALVQPVGAGFSAGDLFDRIGRVARSAAAVVVEPRSP